MWGCSDDSHQLTSQTEDGGRIDASSPDVDDATDDTRETPSWAQLRLRPQPISLIVGETIDMSVEARREGQQQWQEVHDVRWHVVDGWIVEIADDGQLTALESGETQLSARFKGLRAEVQVEVTNQDSDQITIVPDRVSMETFATTTLQVFDSNGTPISAQDVTWESEEQTIATIAASGELRSRELGQTTVKATVGDESASADVFVVSVAQVEIRPAEGEVEVGQPVQLEAVALSEAGDEMIVRSDPTWSSATNVENDITPDGVLTAHEPGKVYVSAEIGGETGSAVFSAEFKFDDMYCSGRWCFGLTTTGRWHGWGYNHSASLGAPTASTKYPVALTGDPALVTIDTGWFRNCGLTASGMAYCWGENPMGAGGSEQPALQSQATPVSSPVAFTTIQAGHQATCGLDVQGALYCWGGTEPEKWSTPLSQSRTYTTTPTLVDAGPFDRLDFLSSYLCARRNSGTWECMGYLNYDYYSDASPTFSELTPLTGSPTYQEVETNYHAACALDQQGQVECWGDQLFGELGQPQGVAGEPVRFDEPTPVDWNKQFVELHGEGAWLYCGVDINREVWCWGTNARCELGMPNEVRYSHTPVRITGLPDDWLELNVTGFGGCVRTSQKDIWCWGSEPSDEALNTSRLTMDNQIPCDPTVTRVQTYQH